MAGLIDGRVTVSAEEWRAMRDEQLRRTEQAREELRYIAEHAPGQAPRAEAWLRHQEASLAQICDSMRRLGID